ncbi:MAG TPA: hypothetical protein VMU24_02845, partial [Candidatus Acidoferrales bacterium]|nr:hypothetical protein [Candidatus Acidoferrales bacterium]
AGAGGAGAAAGADGSGGFCDTFAGVSLYVVGGCDEGGWYFGPTTQPASANASATGITAHTLRPPITPLAAAI